MFRVAKVQTISCISSHFLAFLLFCALGKTNFVLKFLVKGDYGCGERFALLALETIERSVLPLVSKSVMSAS